MQQDQLQRAQLLLQQNRPEEARKILADYIAQYPTDADAFAQYAVALLLTKQVEEAEEAIDTALSLDPTHGWNHYLKGQVMIEKKDYKAAEESLLEAVKLAPYDEDGFAALASLKLAQKQHEEALQYAEQALAINPDHVSALNIKSVAHRMMGDNEEAFSAIDGALGKDPNNPLTHSQYGWALLDKGDYKKAQEHFKEALMANPHEQIAQAGMVEALKSRYFIYRYYLHFNMWMNKLAKGNQWAVIIGSYIAYKALMATIRSVDALSPYAMYIQFAFFGLFFSTWIMGPIGNLLLRINPYGRYLLDETQTKNSTIVGVCAATFLVGIAGLFIYPHAGMIALAAYGLTMMVPGGQLFSDVNPTFFKAYGIGMAALGLATVVLTFMGLEVADTLGTIYLLGFVAFQWAANYYSIER